jgi:hypothetical protein
VSIKVTAQVPADGKIIPELGPLSNLDDRKAYRGTLKGTRDVVRAAMKDEAGQAAAMPGKSIAETSSPKRHFLRRFTI